MATISKLRIANMALSNIGARSSIESFSEGTAEAQQADLWYDYSRLQTLEVHDWSFARKRLTLATHSDEPPAQWAYRYQYPSDCVSFRKLANPAGNNQPAVPFEIETDDDNENKSILTNLDEAVGVYTFDLETTTLYSPFFVELFSFALASHMAMALTGKLKLREAMVATFSQLQRAAPAFNANEAVGEDPKQADWIEGR